MKVSPLGSICSIVNGGTPKSGVGEYWGGDIAWLTPAEMGKRESPHIAATARTITLAGLNNSSAKLIPPGSVILSTRAPIGHLAINETPMSFNQGCRGIVPSDAVDTKFLYYFLLYSRDALNALGTGTTFKELAASKLSAFPVPHPPLQEQRRIVAILDEAFAGIAIANANAERNMANAQALLDSTAQKMFSESGSWKRLTLQELLDSDWIISHLDGNHGENYPRQDEFVDAGVPYISASCLKNGTVDLTIAKFLSEEKSSTIKKGIARNGDVIFAHNATVGPVAILETAEEKVILSTSVTYYRCNNKHILPNYLAHYMRSFDFRSQYERVMRQSTRNQVPITKQREFFHVIPPMNDQTRISGVLDGLEGEVKILMRAYRAKLLALTELKQSLLQKAFAGELH